MGMGEVRIVKEVGRQDLMARNNRDALLAFLYTDIVSIHLYRSHQYKVGEVRAQTIKKQTKSTR